MDSNFITEDNVKQYLSDNINFFNRNPDLIANLNFPHENIGNSTSLLVKQNSMLRKELQKLKKKINCLSTIARENENIHLKFVDWCQSIINMKSRNRVKFLVKSVMTKFGVQLGGVFFLSDPSLGCANISKQYKSHDRIAEAEIKALKTSLVINSKKKLTDWLELLVSNLVVGNSDLAKEINSVAIVPIRFSKSDQTCGVLIFAAVDENQFAADLGTFFLDSLGYIFASSIITKAKS